MDMAERTNIGVVSLGIVIVLCAVFFSARYYEMSHPNPDHVARDTFKFIEIGGRKLNIEKKYIKIISGLDRSEYGLAQIEISGEDYDKIMPTELAVRLAKVYGGLLFRVGHQSRPDLFGRIYVSGQPIDKILSEGDRFSEARAAERHAISDTSSYTYNSPTLGKTLIKCGHPIWGCQWLSNPFGEVVVTHSISREVLLSRGKEADVVFSEFLDHVFIASN